MSLEKLQKEVTYKYGRNVLMFQQLEYMLKHLVATGQVSGPASTLGDEADKQRESVMKRTLGMLVGEHLDPGSPPPLPDHPNEPHFSFSFRMEYPEEKKQQLEQLVEERNHLVHHFLSEVAEGTDGDLADRWDQAGAKLDAQYERLKVATYDIRQVLQGFQEARLAAADYMQSDEFKNQLKQ